MAINLLDMAKGYLTDAVVNRVSGSLNESPENVQKAFAGALPVFLASLISRSSTPDGPTFLTGMLQNFMQRPAAQTPMLDADPEPMMQQGSGLVESIFGPGSNLVSGALATYAGVKNSSASGIMGMAGAVITGLLGRQLASQGSNGLAGLLGEQREAVAAAMPAGLSALMGNIPGLDALNGLAGGLTGAAGSALSGVTGGLGAAGSAATSAFSDVRGSLAGRAGGDSLDAGGGKGFNFLPWLLGALAIAALVYLLRGCGDKNDSTAITSSTLNDTTSASVRDVTATTDSTGNNAGAMMDTASSIVADAAASTVSALGAFGARKLPDGVQLNLPANGVENRLLTFIEDTTKLVDKKTWFDFDRLF